MTKHAATSTLAASATNPALALEPALSDIVSRHGGFLRSRSDEGADYASIYGMLLCISYCLCRGYHYLEIRRVEYVSHTMYMEEFRLAAHIHLNEVIKSGDHDSFSLSQVAMNINTSQHYVHMAFDRIVNDLLWRAFRLRGHTKQHVYHYWLGGRITLARWVSGDMGSTSTILSDLDDIFSSWYADHTDSRCSDVLNDIGATIHKRGLRDGDMDQLVSEIHAALAMIGERGTCALPFVVDRTNQSKHLPEGAKRARLAVSAGDPGAIRDLYRAEWGLTFIALRKLIDLLDDALAWITGGSAPRA